MFLMVVDDDDVDQKMCARAADRSGLVSSLLMFSESEEALKYCANPANQRPDAVLLDLNMPQINGFEFLERIEAEAPNFLEENSIFVLSSSINPEDRARALASLFVADYLGKPVKAKLFVNLHQSRADRCP